MRRDILIRVLYLTAAGIAVAGSAPGQDWESMIAQLRKSDTISCSLVGFAHTPSENYALYQTIVSRGNSESFRRMLEDEHPVVRCVGLLGLAKKDGKKSIRALKEHFSDREVVSFVQYDIFSSMTVGSFAMRLVRDTNCLVLDPLTPGYQHIAVPLLSRNAQIGLEIEVLAGDLCTDLHEMAAYELGEAEEAGELVLDLAVLRRQASSLRDYQIIKAIGRLKPSEDRRAFLIACLHRSKLDADARLAAASALTRKADETALQALRTETDALNRIDEKRWGDYVLKQLKAREAFDANLEPVRANRSWREQEKIKDKVILAFTTNHPLALGNLLDHPAPVLVREHTDVWQALANSLIAISSNLDVVSQPWNTYSNTAVQLDLFIRQTRFHAEQTRRLTESLIAEGQRVPPGLEHRLLTDEECSKIERDIATFLREPQLDRNHR